MSEETLSAEAQEAVRQRLQQLARVGGGRLTPEAVLADAKDKESPLHSHFTWDVKKAAHAYWLDQARALIRSVRIDMKTETTIVSTVAFIRDPGAGKGQGYIAVEALRSQRDLARDALISEFTRVGDQLRRAREIAAALDAQGDVDEILERVVGLRQRFIEAPTQQQ